LDALIPAAPERQRRAPRQTRHVVARLVLEAPAERLVLRVARAGGREVLPDHDAELVARVVEGVVLVDPAAPDAQHVHVRLARLPDAPAVALACDAVREAVVGNPVGALAEDAAPVDPQVKRGAPGLLDACNDGRRFV